MGQLGILTTVSGKLLRHDDPANPCGLVAKNLFNDTFALYNVTETDNVRSETRLFINESDISYDSDRKFKFKRTPGNWTDIQWTDVEDEHFIVWMRTAGLPNFRKLWGRIETDIMPGNYTVAVVNNYDVSDYDASKYFVMVSTN